jgi:hypothetical protein
MAERFDKFTQRARHVLAMAHQEVGNFGQNGIDTEHVLLALIDEGEGIAARVLVAFCGTLPPLRKAVVDRIEQNQGTPAGEIGLTPRAKKLIELAVDEARRLNHRHIGTEHLLMALTRIEEGLAFEVLSQFGIDHNRAVAQVIATITSGRNPGPATGTGSYFGPGIGMPPWIRARWEQHRQQQRGESGQRPPNQQPTTPIDFNLFTERARRVLTLAQEEAQRFNHNYIGTEHLLLGLVREDEGIAARVLRSFWIDLGGVREAVEFIIGRGETMIMGEIGLTPRAKTVLALAVDEARRLSHDYIGTEHLLLGIVREGEGIAAGVLESQGVALEALRARILQVLSGGPTGDSFLRQPATAAPPPSRPTGGAVPPHELYLGTLLQVIPIVQQQERANALLVAIALERYDNGFAIGWRVRLTAGQGEPPLWECTAEDDRGNRYHSTLHGGSADGGTPDDHAWRFAHLFSPALAADARSLTVACAPVAARFAANIGPDSWHFTVAIPPLPEA